MSYVCERAGIFYSNARSSRKRLICLIPENDGVYYEDNNSPGSNISQVLAKTYKSLLWLLLFKPDQIPTIIPLTSTCHSIQHSNNIK